MTRTIPLDELVKRLRASQAVDGEILTSHRICNRSWHEGAIHENEAAIRIAKDLATESHPAEKEAAQPVAEGVDEERVRLELRAAIARVQSAHVYHVADVALEAIRPYLRTTKPEGGGWMPMAAARDEVRSIARQVIDKWSPPESRYQVGFGPERVYMFFVCKNHDASNHERTLWIEIPDALPTPPSHKEA